MHTHLSKNGTLFHYNSDFSGDIIIDFSGKENIEVDGYDVLELVAEFIRNEKISLINQMETNDILRTVTLHGNKNYYES